MTNKHITRDFSFIGKEIDELQYLTSPRCDLQGILEVCVMAKTVGIMGGMGPLATVDMMKRIIENSSVQKEQDHLHMIVDNYPQIPDRIAAIFEDGPDPVPYMAKSARLLERSGADFIVIACNTAHVFLAKIQQQIAIPILDMPYETALYVKRANLAKVGLLATDVTIEKSLYHKPFEELGINVIQPEFTDQEMVKQGIALVKEGELQNGKNDLKQAAHRLIKEGAEAIVLGCTEVALALYSSENFPVIDPTDIMAKTVVRIAYGDR